MNTINKNTSNIKNLLLAITLVFAVGFSAFKNAPRTDDPEWVYVQTDTDEYTRIPYEEYSSGTCTPVTLKPCSFVQPETDEDDHGSQLDYEDIVLITTLEPSSNGFYGTP